MPIWATATRSVEWNMVWNIFILCDLVNTHMHADHVTGTGLLKRAVSTCKSVISKNTPAKADVYVDDGDVIKFGKFQLECRATPGHTDGRCL